MLVKLSDDKNDDDDFDDDKDNGSSCSFNLIKYVCCLFLSSIKRFKLVFSFVNLVLGQFLHHIATYIFTYRKLFLFNFHKRHVFEISFSLRVGLDIRMHIRNDFHNWHFHRHSKLRLNRQQSYY